MGLGFVLVRSKKMVGPSQILSEKQLSKFFSRFKLEKDKALTIVKSNCHKSCPKETSVVVEYYLFSIIANTGLRVSEATHLILQDIGEDFLTIRKEVSKNKKSGAVYFGKTTRRLIDEYLEFRLNRYPNIKDECLFPSRVARYKFLSRSNLHGRFKFWLNTFGLPNHYSIHSLRHSYATLCLDKGLGLTFVRDQLRHSSVSITSRYLHLTKESRDKVKEIF